MSSLPNKGWNLQLREWCTSPFAIIVMTCLFGFVVYARGRKRYPTYDDDDDNDYDIDNSKDCRGELHNLSLTEQQLSQYNSRNPDRIYLVALQGVVYDVSSAPHDFGPGGKYELLPGTDLVGYLTQVASLEQVAVSFYIKEWKIMLEDCFLIAGKLLADPDSATQAIKVKELGAGDGNGNESDGNNSNISTYDDAAEMGQGDDAMSNSTVYAELNDTEHLLDWEPVVDEDEDTFGDETLVPGRF